MMPTIASIIARLCGLLCLTVVEQKDTEAEKQEGGGGQRGAGEADDEQL